MSDLTTKAGGWNDAVRTRRFWGRVAKTRSCWLWTGAINAGGYGQTYWHNRRLLAHRVSWMLAGRGAIPTDRVIDHICRKRNCVNPDHLRLLTIAENVMIGVGPAAINARKTHCVHGHAFDSTNTYVDTSGRRCCRTCRAARERERRAHVR